jgi:hypothetical protein
MRDTTSQPTPPAAVPTPRGTPLTSARSTASPDTRTKSGNLHLVEREKPDLYDLLTATGRRADQRRRLVRAFCIALAAFCVVYFAGQLLRGVL